jgi:Protein of unknown function (DUF3237)
MFCQQVRAKNTSRQRQHLQECPNYLAAMKDSIPANNLLHKFDEGEIARSLQLPTPSLELDFRMSIKLNPRVSLGPGLFGERNWVSFVGGSWAGRWGKGNVIVSHSWRNIGKLDANFPTAWRSGFAACGQRSSNSPVRQLPTSD